MYSSALIYPTLYGDAFIKGDLEQSLDDFKKS